MSEHKLMLDGCINVNENVNIPPVQSANTLFRFFKEPEFLYKTLNRKALVPRYYGEDVRYLNINEKELIYPTICFCDINIHKLKSHVESYGKYGIAFSKEWGISNGIQPINYINSNSVLCKDFGEAFNRTFEKQKSQNRDSTEDGYSILGDYLLTQMYFMKPITGQMPREGEYKNRNFTDEREWRYIPDISTIGLPQVVREEQNAAKTELNKVLEQEQCSPCWLRFEFEDIRYIILSKETDFDDFCDTLDNIEMDKNVRRQIISKVMIWSNVEEDF